MTVTPKTAEVTASKTQQFTAVVAGTGAFDNAVTWTLEDAKSKDTQISSAGLLTIGADETAETLTVKATSVQDSSKFATATVTVLAIETPVITTVTVSPKTAEVTAGETQQFTAKVVGTGEIDKTVDWSVEGAESANTTITEAGLLTVAEDETAETLTVKATSVQDNSKSGTATVKVKTRDAGDTPATGDLSFMWIWLGCLLVSGGGGLFLLLKKRKKEQIHSK